MNELIKIVADNGISVVCVGYLIYFQSVTMKEMLKSMREISDRLTKIEEKIK